MADAPLRRLVTSTRDALKSRTSASGALAAVNSPLSSIAAGDLSVASTLGNRFLSTAAGAARDRTAEATQGLGDYTVLHQAPMFGPAPLLPAREFGGPRGVAGTGPFGDQPLPSFGVPNSEGTFLDDRAIVRGDQGQVQPGGAQIEGLNTDDLADQIQNKIATALAAREQAIADGEQEVIDFYDDQIKTLKEQQLKLAAGRDKINSEYAGLQSQFKGQQDVLAAQEIGATDTDIGGEVVKVSDIFNQGSDELNGLLDAIGADSPALAKQLGSDLQQFKVLAEDRLRTDLGSQAEVTQAAGLFAKKASESLVAFERLDAEEARLVTERDLNKQIQSLADTIDAANKDRAKAIQSVRDSIGDYDSAWIEDFDAVWGVMSDEWFGGMDLTHDEESQLRGLAESMWGSLPAGSQSREGAVQFATQDNFTSNFATIMGHFGVEDATQLEARVQEMLNAQGIRDIAGDGAVLAGWMAKIEAVAKDGNENGALDISMLIDSAIEGGVIGLTSAPSVGDSTGPLDLATLEDWADVFDYVELRADFNESGYDEFRDETLAGLAGGSFSSSAVDGSTLTVKDMYKTSASGSTVYIHPGAGPSFDTMVEAARRDGVDLGVSDSYRSWATQDKAYRGFLATGTNLAGNKVPNIANPNDSNHPKGLAVDFNIGSTSDKAYKWLSENASRYGWGGISNEAWHWEYRGNLGTPTSSTPPLQSGSRASASTLTATSAPVSDATRQRVSGR